jgi:putative addiction module component (TIGR02574 family)
MSTLEIKKMSIYERLQAMEELWDSLLYHEAVESPEWHKDILEQRQAKIDLDEAEFVSLEELKTKYRNRE